MTPDIASPEGRIARYRKYGIFNQLDGLSLVIRCLKPLRNTSSAKLPIRSYRADGFQNESPLGCSRVRDNQAFGFERRTVVVYDIEINLPRPESFSILATKLVLNLLQRREELQRLKISLGKDCRV
jgi:hypothetical protein